MSTTHRNFRLNAVITDRGKTADPAGRFEATFGWARASGPSAAYACGELAGQITDAAVCWKRPELITHGSRTAILYTRPDGGAGYDLYSASGTTVACTVTTSPPPGQTGPDAEWQAARKAAWHSVVQAGTDYHDDASVWAGWDALSGAGYSDLAQDHLRYAGWQRAYQHATDAGLPENERGSVQDRGSYALHHAERFIPTRP